MTDGANTWYQDFHFIPALLGNVDPAFVAANLPHVGSFDTATVDTYVDTYTAAGTFVSGLLTEMRNASLFVGTLSANSAAVISRTEPGPVNPSGTHVGYKYEFGYNPDAGEATAGIGQAEACIYVMATDLEPDVRIIEFGATGTVVIQDPTVVLQNQSQAAGWGDLSASNVDIATNITDQSTLINILNLFSPGTVTKDSDQGQPGTHDVQFFNDTATTEIYTTAFMPAVIKAGGSTAVQGTSSIAGWVMNGLIAWGLYGADLIKNFPSWLLGVEAVKDNLPSLSDLTELGQLTGINSQLISLNNSIDTIELDFTNAANSLDRIADALEAMQYQVEPEVPELDPPNLHNVVKDLAHQVELMTELRTTINLKAKGIQVDAFTGAVEGAGP
jgi:hypothetical protein